MTYNETIVVWLLGHPEIYSMHRTVRQISTLKMKVYTIYCNPSYLTNFSMYVYSGISLDYSCHNVNEN